MPLLLLSRQHTVDNVDSIMYNAKRLKMGSRNAARFLC